MTAHTQEAPVSPAARKAARWQEKIDDIAAEAIHIRGTDDPDHIARRLGYATIANLIGALERGGHQTIADQLATDRDEWRERVKAYRNGR